MFTPKCLAPAFWLDASDPAGRVVVDGKISQLIDKSGNGRHFSQSNASARPVFVESGQAGRDICRFGGAQFLASDWTTTVVTGTAIAVFAASAASADQSALLSKNSYWAVSTGDFPVVLYIHPSGTSFSASFSNGASYVATVTLNSPAGLSSAAELIGAEWGPTQCRLFHHGEVVASGPGVTVSNNGRPWTVGRAALEYYGGVGRTFLVGDLCELILLSTALTDEQLTALNAYLFDRWGARHEMAGTATVHSGGPVDRVLVFDWQGGELAGMTEPNETGGWSLAVLPGVYGVTYLAEGCAPVTHGPYTVPVGE